MTYKFEIFSWTKLKNIKPQTWILKNLSKKHNNNHMDEVFTNANETHKLLEEPRT